MPTGTALPKVEATRAYGAEVRLTGEVGRRRHAPRPPTARGHRRPPGRRPFDDRAGHRRPGHLGLELAEEMGDAETVLVPVGGGGLISGVAAALAVDAARRAGDRGGGGRARRRWWRRWPPASRSALAAVRTIADGIALKSPVAADLRPRPGLVDDVVTVTDEEIGRALILLLERAKAVVEPAGAVGSGRPAGRQGAGRRHRRWSCCRAATSTRSC